MKKIVIYFTTLTENKNKNENVAQKHHQAGEALLAIGLSELYGKELSKLERQTGPYGKPGFKDEPQICYNISHSGKYVLCAFYDREIGIDVQKMQPVNIKALLPRVVPAAMIPQVLESSDPMSAFYTEWVLREAYIKWTGRGISQDMREARLNEGDYMLLDLEDGYKGAVFTGEPADIVYEYREVKLEQISE